MTTTATSTSSKVISSESAQAKRVIANANAKKAVLDVKRAQANDLDKEDQSDEIVDVKPSVKPVKPAKEPKPTKDPKITKKSVVIEMISAKGGASVKDIGQAIVDRGIDADLEKNIRVVRLWLPKLGIKVEKLESGNYHKA